MMYFLVGFFVQFWVRRGYPAWFLRYDYIIAAAIGGGTELLVLLPRLPCRGPVGGQWFFLLIGMFLFLFFFFFLRGFCGDDLLGGLILFWVLRYLMRTC